MAEELVFNGVDISTGDYAHPPIDLGGVADAILGQAKPQTQPEKDHLADLNFRKTEGKDSFAVKAGVNAQSLAAAGWGVIFPAGFNQEVLDALRPLLNHRRDEAGPRYREFTQATGDDRCYQPLETKRSFLKARKANDSGAADPDRVPCMPYYLLLVGDPTEIPFSFQYELDLQYAVGRIHFDSIADYAQYARNVVASETGSLALERKLTFFGPENEGDAATRLSSKLLIEPLVKQLASVPDWKVEAFLRDDATKGCLKKLMGGSSTPAILFTASHGASLKPFDDPEVYRLNGALMCQEWIRSQKPAPRESYFCGGDIAPGSNLFGTIAMHFACFSGGSPATDNFPTVVPVPPRQIAPAPFVANLPKRMLVNGALATIAHIDRAFGYSFHAEEVPQVQDFESVLKDLMGGCTVGFAMERFNARYAELATTLLGVKEAASFTDNATYMVGLWTATNDSRNYLVIGDPAARLHLATPPAPPLRPEIPLVSHIAEPAAVPAPAPPPEVQTAAAPLPESEAVDFGISETIESFSSSLSETADKLAASLQRVITGIATVEVRTYTSDRMAEVRYVNGAFTGAQLRAYSAISLAGQAVNCVPEKDGVVDTALWQIHSEATVKALQSRAELLKSAAAAIASLAHFMK